MRILAFLLLAMPVAADSLDRKTLKRMEDFGERWWKARPKSKFHEWDPQERAALLEEARAFGAIPEGSLEKVRDVLWKSVRRHGPRGKGRGKVYIEDHGYKSKYTRDEMWALFKGGGRNKGLCVSLHGGGEGAGSADAWSMKGCMTIAPQGLLIHGDNWNRVHGEKQVLTFIEIAKAQYDIDPDRVYVVGFSMGGTGSWHFAGRFPDLFAGAAPCNGVVMASPKSQLKSKDEIYSIQYGLVPNVRNLPMYFCTGTEDENCMPGTFLYTWDVIQELREGDPGGYEDIRFECHEGLAHTFGPGQPSKALKWLGEFRRDTYPERLKWEYAAFPHPLPDGKDKTTRFQKRRFYWIRHDHPEDKMEIRATRNGNEIDVRYTGLEKKGLYVMLNPKMIDVKEEVVVRLEGEEIYRGKPQPDFVTVLESLSSRLDKSLTFDRKVALWTPPRAPSD